MNIKRLVWNAQKMFQIKPDGESDMSPTYVCLLYTSDAADE